MTERFDLWLKRYRVRSTSVLTLSLWMLVDCQLWAKAFAHSSTLDGLGTAAVIAAVTTPATFLAGWAFKIFQESRPL